MGRILSILQSLRWPFTSGSDATKLHMNSTIRTLFRSAPVTACGLACAAKCGQKESKDRTVCHRLIMTNSSRCHVQASDLLFMNVHRNRTHCGAALVTAVAHRRWSSSTSWVERAPTSLRPYLLLARVDKPAGTWLLLWPCWWSIAIVAPAGALPDLLLMSKFAAGAFFMRGAGCTINDLWDRDIDAQVPQPRDRDAGSKRCRLDFYFQTEFHPHETKMRLLPPGTFHAGPVPPAAAPGLHFHTP